ncbi:response regulator [Prolixibacteraceae bacterium JC049]|nr:response regulator [Prolixibacteraceae bacterium JC049]
MREKDSNYLKKELYDLVKTDEKIFDFIQESSMDGLCYRDLENIDNEWRSDKFWKVLGYDPKEMATKPSAWKTIVNKEDYKLMLDNLQKHLENPAHNYSQVVRFTHKDGSTVWFRCQGIAIRDKNGAPIRMLGSYHNLTNLKKREAELIAEKEKAEKNEKQLIEQNKKLNETTKQYIELEKRLQFALTSSQTGAWDLDLIDHTAIRTLQHDKIFGYEELLPEWTYEMFIEHVLPEHREHVDKKFNTAVELKSVWDFECEIKRCDGVIRWIRARGQHQTDEQGNAYRMAGIVQDITEQKKHEQILLEAKEKAEKSQELLQLTHEATKDGIWDWHITSNDVFYSKGWLNILEVDKVEPTYETWASRIHPKDKEFTIQSLKDHLAGKTKQWECDHRMKINNKRWKWVKGRGMVVQFDENNQPTRMVGTMTDIELQKKAEQELIIAKEKAEESDRLKTEFINNMSHEIRTPMNGILGFSNLLNKEDLSAQKQKRYTDIIQSSGKQLMRVIDDILEISKLETKQVKAIEKPFSLNDLLLQLFSIFDIKAKENKTPLYLKKGLTDKASEVYSDESKLNKILSNLIENALKFTSEGYIEFGYHLNNNDIELYVKDTGIGISKDKQEIIFDRFSQEQSELAKNVGGLGLGLSIAKENAELLGGNIRLISEKSKGSNFIVTIPYKPANTDNEVFDIQQAKSAPTILIAEDEEVNYLFLEALLENETDMRYHIIHSKNGQEAIDTCKSEQHIDLVFMDIKMPIVNGYDATKSIKNIKPDIPIVIQTAYTTNEDRAKAFSSGCDDFITKPISEESINHIINKYLH